MKLLSLSFALFAATAAAFQEQQQQLEMQDILSQLTQLSAAQPPKEDPVACWKQVFNREPDMSVCGDDQEWSGAACYKKCDAGFHGFGPYCLLARTASQAPLTAPSTYQRKPTTACSGTVVDSKCYAQCPATTADLGSLCTSECPQTLPFTCGIACAKNALTCTKEVADITTLGYKLILDVQSGNWPGVITTGKKLLEKLKSIPACKDLDGRAQDADVLARVIDLLRGLKQ